MKRLIVLLGCVAAPLAGQTPPPIIDMHLHALGANDQGPAPVAICAPFETLPSWDQRRPYPATMMEAVKNPTCSNPLWSPRTDDELRDETIAVVRRLNVYGVLSGPTARVQAWRAAAPGRFLAGFGFRLGRSAPSPDSLRSLFEAGALEVLAEVTNQYVGIAPDDERMEPYWALAEELDMPVGVHMGPGPPGAPYLERNYRARLSSALLLEDVLVRHPSLRIYVMHAGYPLIDDAVALLYAHPQVHVGVGIISFGLPRASFYDFLRRLVEAGFEDRILFGSDQMVWPQAIEEAVRSIEEAPFLTDAQKRKILYDNAARFLRLDEAERARHRGR